MTDYHYQVSSITVEVVGVDSAGQPILGTELSQTLVGAALQTYCAICWQHQPGVKAPPVLLEDHYNLKNDAGSLERLKVLREKWQGSPAIEKKKPDCTSDSFP